MCQFNKMFFGNRKLLNYIIILMEITTIKAKIYILSSELTFNPIYVEEHRITIHPDKLGVDTILYLAQDWPLEHWVRVTISIKSRKTNRYREVFATDNNICRIVGKGQNNFMSIWVSRALKRSNLPSVCPYPKGRYAFSNLSSENIGVPKFLTGMYKANVETYFRRKSIKDMVANLTLTAQIK